VAGGEWILIEGTEVVGDRLMEARGGGDDVASQSEGRCGVLRGRAVPTSPAQVARGAGGGAWVRVYARPDEEGKQELGRDRCRRRKGGRRVRD